MTADRNGIGEFLVSRRWLLFLVASICALTGFFTVGEMELDRSIESLFPANDPILEPFYRLQRRFGGNAIILAAYQDDELLAEDGSGIRRNSVISERLRGVEGVRSVLSLAKVDEALRTLNRMRSVFRFGGDEPLIVDRERRLSVEFLNLFENYTHGADGKTAAVVCMLSRDSIESRQRSVAQMREIMSDLPEGLKPGMIVGEPVMVVDGMRYVQEDGRRLTTWSSALLGLTIGLLFCSPRYAIPAGLAAFLCLWFAEGWVQFVLLAVLLAIFFRPLRWVAIPIIVVQLTDRLARVVFALVGFRLTMVSSMLTAIVTVIGVATVVHMIVWFREFRSKSSSDREALVRTLSWLAAPVGWACLTDAVGFTSLCVSDIGPVSDFGLMMGAASLMVLFGVATLAPALWLFAGPTTAAAENPVAGSPSSVPRFEQSLAGLAVGVQRWRTPLTAALVLLLLFAITGLPQLEVETDFTRNFRRSSPIVRAYGFVEGKFGGAGVVDVMVPAPKLLERDFLARVRALESDLQALQMRDSSGESVPAFSKVISLVDLLDASRADPMLSMLPAELVAQGLARTTPQFSRALRTPNPDSEGRYFLRLMMRSSERRPAPEKLKLIEETKRLATKYFPPSERGESDVTGFFVLLTHLISGLARDQWLCFAAAVIAIFVMMLLALRSLRLAVIALVPNAMPILLVLGGMGWIGLPINMGAAMIAAVSMGLSIDSSIHYLTAFRRARADGGTTAEALQQVHRTVGRALVLSTIALIVGFLALCVSEFVPTIYFGALVGCCLAGGLLGNLVMLPMLLGVAYK